MGIFYENWENLFVVFETGSKHTKPHLHKHLELLLVTSGTLELGIGTEFFHMEKGDFAIVFPNLIHHYQVFSKGRNRTLYLLADTSFAGADGMITPHMCPADPIIRAGELHPDVRYAMKQLLSESGEPDLTDIRRAFIQLILARTLPSYRMVDTDEFASTDLVYQTVQFISEHFNENISQTDVAHALGISPTELSRVFSYTFHTNFKRFLNEKRLNQAAGMLLHTDLSITDICFYCGFESQRTFNRAFKAYLRMTPREYRNSRGAEEEE